MCIVEINGMDIISINKTIAKESKQTKTNMALKRAILNEKNHLHNFFS